MQKRTLAGILAALVMAVTLTGCGGSSDTATATESDSAAGMSYSPVMSYNENAYTDPTYTGSDTEKGAVEAARENVKRIYTGEISLESVNFDGTMEKLEDLVEDAGGYFQSNEVFQRDSYGSSSDMFRQALITVRIPAEEFDGFLQELDEGKGFSVTRRSVSTEDVSEQYYDIQVRIESARLEVARLEELMGKAENVSDVISVQQALSDATYRLESLLGQLKGMDSRIQYSTLEISLVEVTALTMTAKTAGFGNKLLESLTKGFTGGVEFVSDFILTVAGNWLVILIIGSVILIIVSIRRRRKRRKKQSQEE